MYTLRFFSLQNAVCFIILTYLVPALFTFYIQGVLKLKNNSGANRLIFNTSKCTIIKHTPSHIIHQYSAVIWPSYLRQDILHQTSTCKAQITYWIVKKLHSLIIIDIMTSYWLPIHSLAFFLIWIFINIIVVINFGPFDPFRTHSYSCSRQRFFGLPIVLLPCGL